MTPKRLRLIAHIIRRGLPANTPSTLAIADELDEHALEVEDAERCVKRMPRRTVLNDLAEMAERKKEV